MGIGCLFTLKQATSLLFYSEGMVTSPQTHRHIDNATQVIDEIVCRSLKIVNTDGEDRCRHLSSEGAVALTLRKYYKGSILTQTRLSALGITFSEGQRVNDNKLDS